MGLAATFLLLIVSATILSVVVSARGCRRRAVIDDADLAVGPVRPETNPFDIAVDFLNRLDEFEPALAQQQILYNLRQWVREQPPAVEWIADPMARRLPEEFTGPGFMEQLAEFQFQPHDALVLREAVWLRDVARSVARRPATDDRLEAWLQGMVAEGQLTPDQVSDLSVAARLFDWVVRHHQQDPEQDDVEQIAARQDEPAGQAVRYVYYAWENLREGHGDALELGRLFILLARQRGIPAVMLAVDTPDQTAPSAWVPAALVGDQLYLFDMQMGLPVPGPDNVGIATLAKVLDDPDLLRQLADEGASYRLRPRDLRNLVALIDATPAHLSQRMKLVESRLAGDQKMVVTVAATPLAVKLRACRGINRVDIWTLPYEAYRARRRLMQGDLGGTALFDRLVRQQRPLERLTPLVQGRLLQFRGQFDNTEDQPGARAYLLQARTSKQDLQNFDVPFDQVPPDSPLLAQLPPADERARRQRYEQLMAQAKELAILSKQYATHWLGLIAQETGRHDVAVDYFQARTLDAEQESPLAQAARYNLARCWEALGRRDGDVAALDRAAAIYVSDPDSPRAAGNRVRARRLQTLIDRRDAVPGHSTGTSAVSFPTPDRDQSRA
jgi:hypothetical protein